MSYEARRRRPGQAGRTTYPARAEIALIYVIR